MYESSLAITHFFHAFDNNNYEKERQRFPLDSLRLKTARSQQTRSKHKV